MPATYYPAVIDRSASGYGVSFPDFPGLVAAGDTVHDAALSAEIGLSLHLKGMIDDMDAIPVPSSLDDIEPIDEVEDVARILVRAETPAKFSRVQVTLEDSLLAAIDAHAPNRSGFLSQAAWAALRNGQVEARYRGIDDEAPRGKLASSVAKVSRAVEAKVAAVAMGSGGGVSRKLAESALGGKPDRKHTTHG